jgi:hypothetical protein
LIEIDRTGPAHGQSDAIDPLQTSIDLNQKEHAALRFQRKMIAELAANLSECNRVEVAMQRSIQSENIVPWYRKLIAVAEDDPARRGSAPNTDAAIGRRKTIGRRETN